MFAIDTNLLVYAHNIDSEFNEKATTFLEEVLNFRDENGDLDVCLPSQVITEFVNVITRNSLAKPLSLNEAIEAIEDYLAVGVKIIHQQETQIETFLELLGSLTTRKKIFDVALSATLKDNNITGLYTVNDGDFIEFEFLEVRNPLD